MLSSQIMDQDYSVAPGVHTCYPSINPSVAIYQFTALLGTNHSLQVAQRLGIGFSIKTVSTLTPG